MVKKQKLVALVFILFIFIFLFFSIKTYNLNNITFEEVSIETPSEVHFYNIKNIDNSTDIKSLNYNLNGHDTIKSFSISNYTGNLMIDFSNIIVESIQSKYLFFKINATGELVECKPINVKLYEYIDEDCIIGVIRK